MKARTTGCRALTSGRPAPASPARPLTTDTRAVMAPCHHSFVHCFYRRAASRRRTTSCRRDAAPRRAGPAATRAAAMDSGLPKPTASAHTSPCDAGTPALRAGTASWLTCTARCRTARVRRNRGAVPRPSDGARSGEDGLSSASNRHHAAASRLSMLPAKRLADKDIHDCATDGAPALMNRPAARQSEYFDRRYAPLRRGRGRVPRSRPGLPRKHRWLPRRHRPATHAGRSTGRRCMGSHAGTTGEGMPTESFSRRTDISAPTPLRQGAPRTLDLTPPIPLSARRPLVSRGKFFRSAAFSTCMGLNERFFKLVCLVLPHSPPPR